MQRGGHVPSRTNQYLKSHFSESIRFNVYHRIPQINGYRWLQILGQWKFPGAPCIQDSEHRSCKTLFHFHFERSGGSLGTNTSILPSTLEDHHEPDSGTVQPNKELVVKKNSFQNEQKGYKRIQSLLAKT